MELFVRFPDFSKTSALDKFIEKRLQSLHRRLDRRFEGSEIILRGAVLNRTVDGTPKDFEAELMVKLPKSKSPFVVKKKNKNFRSALSDAVDAMETILERDHDKSGRARKNLGHSRYPVRKVKRTGALPKKRQ